MIPRVPVRQRVLSFPIPLRCLLHIRSCLRLSCKPSNRVISTFLIQQAGLKRTEADTGAVTLNCHSVPSRSMNAAQEGSEREPKDDLRAGLRRP
jgi:hypothetical protein